MMNNILLTGGGGYIGSHVTRQLASSENYHITVIDNLKRGYRQPIEIIQKEYPDKVDFFKVDLLNKKSLFSLPKKHFDAVMHFAAFISVGESVEKPLEYFENNVCGSNNLLEFMKNREINRLIFSSTSALYSKDAPLPFTEESEINPENPYAESKFMMEKVIKWYENSSDLTSFILRYFNPCGCSLDTKIGYSKIPAPQLMPAAIRGALGLQDFKLTCGKVDTPDGTTIRDYFNILDLAEAHKIALDKLLEGHVGGTYNVGMGKGHTVKQIIDIVEKVTGHKFVLELGEPRKGELPVVYCDPSKFEGEFGWKTRYDLEQAAKSLYDWYKKRPNGYKS